uniref:Uncharacterized protein n=1 Tax=Glossina palpalis gambiensis TaxID=67801 RepID=A0A1B0B8Z8_9MUSC
MIFARPSEPLCQYSIKRERETKHKDGCYQTNKRAVVLKRTEQKKAKAIATKQETKTKLQCLTEIVASNSDDYKQERHSSVTTLQSRHAKRAKHVQEFATTSLIAIQQLFNTI